MASVNRYTNIQPNQYNPRSLQELMMAPAYKREQHNNMEDSIAENEAAIAQADSLGIHGDLAREEQARLSGDLTSQAEKLQAEGFNSTSRSDFIRLNKDYQQSISPTGKLGKIQAAKDAMGVQKETYIANATAEGLPSDIAAANWDDHVADYTNKFNESGDIRNIDPRYGAKYVDVVEEFDKKVKDLGLTSVMTGGSSSGIVFDKEKGTYVQSRGSEHLNASNKEQLGKLNEWLKNQINNPQSEIGRSLKEQRKTATQAMSDIQGYSGMFEKSTTKDIVNSSISNYSPAKGDVLTNSGIGLTLSNEQFAPAKHQGKTYSELSSRITDLNTIDNMTDEEKQEYTELSKFKENLDARLAQDNKYNEYTLEVDTHLATIDAISNGNYDFQNDPVIELAKKKGTYNSNFLGDYRQSLLNRHQQALGNVNRELDEYIKPQLQDHTIKSSNYTLTPHTPKQEGLIKVMNHNIENLFQTNPENIKSMVNVENLVLEGSNYGDITSNDKDGIAKILHKAGPGALKLTQVTPQGYSGKPEYVLKVQTTSENSYNVDGWGGVIGGGEPLEIRVSFNDIGNAHTSNVNGYVEEFLRTSSASGKSLADDMEYNRKKSNYVGRSWGDISDTDVSNDPVLEDVLIMKLQQLGLNGESTEEEIAEARLQIRDKKIQ